MTADSTPTSTETKLIEIAARLADRQGVVGPDWLRAFRRHYRHLAVTYGHRFGHASLSDADKATDQAIDSTS